jgi:hypothetical protein
MRGSPPRLSEAKASSVKRRKRMMQKITKQPLFGVGQLVATPGALAALEKTGQSAVEFLARHVTGDWGEVPLEDRTENFLSVERGFRVLSSYRTLGGERIWVITVADRSLTTLLLPVLGTGHPLRQIQESKTPSR